TSLAGVQRLGALYEESGHLDGGSIDRSTAAERWRVERVMLGEGAGGSVKERQAWHDAATARLIGWAHQLRTPLGRGAAAAKAAGLEYATKRVEALKLIEEVLPKTPESDVAVELRQWRHNILEKVIGMSTVVTRDGKGAIKFSTRNVPTIWLRLYRM